MTGSIWLWLFKNSIKAKMKINNFIYIVIYEVKYSQFLFSSDLSLMNYSNIFFNGHRFKHWQHWWLSLLCYELCYVVPNAVKVKQLHTSLWFLLFYWKQEALITGDINLEMPEILVILKMQHMGQGKGICMVLYKIQHYKTSAQSI